IECTEGHPAQGEKWLRQALRVKPRDSDLLFRLYKCLQQQPDPERQREAVEVRALHEAVLGDMRKLRDLKAGPVERSTHDPDMLYEVGAIWLRLGEDRMGLDWLYRALKEDPRHKRTHEILFKYYRDKHEPDKADEHRRALDQLKQDSPSPGKR